MSLNPQDRKNWHGFLDLLQPPAGYRLVAAVGTTFGLSIDALTAALLAMIDADGETMSADPVAALLAMTRLRSRVRVLVHPATISGGTASGSRRLVALLDGLILQVQPSAGLFHPKVWVLRFGPAAPSSTGEIGRVIVGSRNLSSSTSFELGAVFEGNVVDGGGSASPFSRDVADAVHAWLANAKSRTPDSRLPSALVALPAFLRRLAIDTPHEASSELRLRWQGDGRKSLAALLPASLDRAVVVSPFVRPDFVSDILARTTQLHIVSTQDALDSLDDVTMTQLAERQRVQGAPVLYQVTDHGDPDTGYIDGIHAKLLLAENDAGNSVTFVGSANATGPGWGTGGPSNVEAMAEIRPGIGLDRFIVGFIRESKTKVHPWIMEYDPSTRNEPDRLKEAERKVLAALREVAKMNLAIRYDSAKQVLTISRVSARAFASAKTAVSSGLQFELAPLLLNDRADAWRRIEELAKGDLEFTDVPIACLTAFLALRVRSLDPPIEKTRLVLASINVTEAELDRRDDAIREEIMANADPASVLNALIRGISYLGGSSPVDGKARGGRQNLAIRQLLGETSLEHLLQAVAIEPGLIREMRLLLGSCGGASLLELCNRLENAVQHVRTETES